MVGVWNFDNYVERFNGRDIVVALRLQPADAFS
jgi:hypothetical protein